MHDIIHSFWQSTDVSRNLVEALTVTTHCLLALGISGLVYLLFLKVITPLVTKLVLYSHREWDEIMFNPRILRATSFVVFAIVLHVSFPPACRPYGWLYAVGLRTCHVLLVIAIVRLINRIINACYDLLSQNQRVRMQPLKGIAQMLKLICIIIGVIICISIVIDKDPGIILGSLGASAAVLMLVFKDTILGVVAGVQLSANDMLRKGDWIVVPDTDVNGVVQDVTLTTVKVQNFDNTTLTVPPYTLISGSFQNWRGMTDSGGRRIMRSINIDVQSVRFCTDDELERYKQYPWFARVTDFIDTRPVNLTVFRYYLEAFIKKFHVTNTEYTYMVRQLQPTDSGVPVQLYCFTSQTDWKAYEHIQADIFDHIYAMIGVFGLRIYQQPSADDIRGLREAVDKTPAPSAPPAFDPEWLKADGGIFDNPEPAEPAKKQPEGPEAPVSTSDNATAEAEADADGSGAGAEAGADSGDGGDGGDGGGDGGDA